MSSPAQRQQWRSLREKVATLASELRAKLADHPSKADYDRCMAAGGPLSDECVSIAADVINFAIFSSKGKQRIGGGEFELDKLVDGPDWSAAGEVLAELAATSDDPLERITALMFMRYDTNLSLPANEVSLPEAAYRGIAHKPITESALIAERHRYRPLPPTAVEPFVELAQSEDNRARRAALLALGHTESSQQLHDVVLGLPLTSDTWFDVSLAVTACGLRCSETMMHVLTTASEGARIAMYEALGFAPDAERKQMVELALASAPKVIGERERTLRDELLADALSGTQ